MNLVGRKFTHVEFKSYLDSLDFTPWAKFVVIHNTSQPDIALYNTWQARQGRFANWTPEQWLRNLASYYTGMGWSGGPHLCIPPTPDTILVLNALSVSGVHTPSWNKFSFGVETVGEFEREPFGDPTKDNLVFALAAMHKRFNFDPADYQLGVKGLHFHKEDHATTHRSCPGKNMIKSELVSAVVSVMNPSSLPDTHAHDIPLPSQEIDTSKLNSVELVSIYWLQAALNLWKPALKLSVNGQLDAATSDAIKTFQMNQGLKIDGVPAGVTRVALKHSTAA
jgi:peptidoglycan hydrolase-like protein with peptidoglycan-binding domain